MESLHEGKIQGNITLSFSDIKINKKVLQKIVYFLELFSKLQSTVVHV